MTMIRVGSVLVDCAALENAEGACPIGSSPSRKVPHWVGIKIGSLFRKLPAQKITEALLHRHPGVEIAAIFPMRGVEKRRVCRLHLLPPLLFIEGPDGQDAGSQQHDQRNDDGRRDRFSMRSVHAVRRDDPIRPSLPRIFSSPV